ncbi:GNAT family N-acetyltransferase [Noviherbaspirillum cavernae]|uniref:GNAT family N-acetyltransferase n=1 Tax=Noviherbaspirillum cavernae TaxID=2320862 RepID=UPI001314B04F|nr:GNAT family N-acetyltransferase [Noviherbaspirillum cavernae]
MYSSLAQFSVYGNLTTDTCTYVARQHGIVIALLLLRIEGEHVRVLNEQIDVGAAEIERFARYMFSSRPSLKTIRFRAIQTTLHRFSFPCQQVNISEDIVVSLPDTSDDYAARLGKATRKNIKHHLSRLRRSFPTLVHQVRAREEASEQHVREIVALNRARMAGKNKVSYIDDEEEERIVRLVKLCGVVSVMTLDDRVCAGVICYQVGSNYFSLVNGHATEYDDYRLGTLCFHQTICACIERGGKEFHFMWGQYPYKYMLLGVQRDLNNLVIYRSRMQVLLNSHTAMRIAFSAQMRRVKFWLLQQGEKKNDPRLAARIIPHCLSILKNLRQHTAGLLPQRK